MQIFNINLTMFFCHAILSRDMVAGDIVAPPLVKHPLLLNRPPSIKQK